MDDQAEQPIDTDERGQQEYEASIAWEMAELYQEWLRDEKALKEYHRYLDRNKNAQQEDQG